MMGFRVKFLPYCLQLLADGSVVVLNRDYKPVGSLSGDFVTYESCPSQVQFKMGLTDLRLAKLDYRGAGRSGDVVYFYNDGCVPFSSAAATKAYFERLELLDSLQLIPAD